MTDPSGSSRDAAYFAALYDVDPDPWNFAASAYEHHKYQATLAALDDRRFARAFEIGCSIGVLTRRLAQSCTNLLAVDLVQSALDDAKARCQDQPHVGFARLRVPEQWPLGAAFDLILISEVLYFLDRADIVRVADHVMASLSPGGTVLLVNYTEPIDEPTSGATAAETFIAAVRSKLHVSFHKSYPKFRIDRLDT